MARSAIVRTDRYTGVAIAFHWIIGGLVIVNLILGLFHENLLRGVPVIPAHKAIGITVLVLSIGRLLWRLTHRPPPFPLATPRWEKAVARGTHALFYVLMIVMPLSGWAMSSAGASPRPISWFGLFPIPDLPVSAAAGGSSHETHVVLGWLMAALVVLHVAAALRHHLILRDATLARMLPFQARRTV